VDDVNLAGLIRDEVNRRLASVKTVVRRGVLSAQVGATYFCQVQGHGAERYSDVEVWQPYGFASRAPAGSEAIVVNPDGRGEGAIVILVTSRANRPGLEDGEACIHGEAGSSQPIVKVAKNGDIELSPESGSEAKVGRGATEKILKGSTFNTNLSARLQAVFTILVAWSQVSPPNAATNAAAIQGIWDMLWGLWQDMGGLGSQTTPPWMPGTDWLAEEGRVK